jgi:hypothetical protein
MERFETINKGAIIRMKNTVSITKRLGTAPKERSLACVVRRTCPDIFALSSGDFAIIGKDVTTELRDRLPSDAGCSEVERIIVIPREVLLAAKPDIPDI